MEKMEFAQYLKENSQKETGRERLFTPGLHDEGGNQTWTLLKQPQPIGEADWTAAEQRLNCQFPAGYRTFLEVLGPGIWAGAAIPHPSTLYAFDEATGEMCGFIAVGCNVDGCGNYVAFNPNGEENILYFVSHDPFGHAVVAESFEQWIKRIGESVLADPKDGIYAFYNSLSSFKESVPSDAARSNEKPWWQFW